MTTARSIRPALLLLSADTEGALRARVRSLRAALSARAISFEGACAGAARCAPRRHRLATVASGAPELIEKLDAFLAGRAVEGLTTGQAGAPPALAFVFSGQGPEWCGMGRELWATDPAFRGAVTACDEALIAAGEEPISREFTVDEAGSRLGDAGVAARAITALQIGLTAAWRALGVVPDAVVGHSAGELGAACAAGALSPADSMSISLLRSRLMMRLAGRGGMAVVDVGPGEASRAIAGLEDRVAVAVVNSPVSTVLSGERAALDEALARLAAQGIGHRPIPMNYPVHSPAMRAVARELPEQLQGLSFASPRLPCWSSVTGAECRQLGAAHWRDNIAEPALFASAIDGMLAAGHRVFVEIGPHPVLGGVIAQNAAGRGSRAVVLPSLRRRQPERATMRAALGELFVLGLAIDPEALFPGDATSAAALEEALTARASEDSGPAETALVARLRASSAPRRGALLVDALRALLARRIGAEPDPARPLRELGVDSVGAVALAEEIGLAIGRRLPATLFFEYATIEALAAHLLGEILSPGEERAAEPGEAPARPIAGADEPIAIVGIGCRFPGGVAGPEALFGMLLAGTDAVGEVPASRWDLAATFDPDPDAAGKTYSKWGGFLDQVDGFDAAFFGIAPREADSMDPQQRLLLETSWEALEHAGIAPDRLAGSRTGVFVGLCTNDYGGPLLHRDLDAIDAYTLTGNAASVAGGRISYVLGLEGPNLSVDTACSSSLVAVHLACQSLRSGESDLALAGGVNLILSPALHVYFSRLRAMSPTGRCRSFDASADGYVRAEGCGVLVLERLSDALAAGREIVAVIRGSAVNQDGRSNGLTAPNGLAQQAVVREALRRAGVAPREVGYVEAHGTGTPLGDPVELRALGAVLREGRAPGEEVLVGSIKSNFGHAEGAAGVAGLIKAALALRHGRLPGTLHFQAPNPAVPWADLPLRVVTDSLAWEGQVAAVSAFGFSGTNAHVVLGKAPPRSEAAGRAPGPFPLRLSARSPRALAAQAERLHAHLAARPDLALLDLSFTLSRRAGFEHRAALVARDRGELLASLAELARGEGAPVQARPGRLAAIFTGQGSQRAGMGHELARVFPAFREAHEAALAGFSPALRARLDGSLDDTSTAQPALFAFEVALHALLGSWGIVPELLAGHSVGEIAAAQVAGVLSLADAAALVEARGALMGALPPGGVMVALEASEDEVLPWLTPQAHLAAVNGPRAVVISGDEDAVSDVIRRFSGRRASRLAVSHAFHSHRMEPMLEAFREIVEKLDFRRAQLPIVSTVSGEAPDAVASPDYWVRQVRAPVRFLDAVRSLEAAGATELLEIGPQRVLGPLAAACVGEQVASLSTARPGVSEVESLIEALGTLDARGRSLDHAAFFAPLGARIVALPTVAFERRRCWVAPSTPAARARHQGASDSSPPIGAPASHPLLGAPISVAETGGFLFVGRISLTEHPWLRGHEVRGRVILPGTAFLDLALFASNAVGLGGVEELVLEAPLALPEQAEVSLQLAIGPLDGSGRRSLGLHARTGEGPWTRHAAGTIGHVEAAKSEERRVGRAPEGAIPLALGGLHERLAERGFVYGERFRGLKAAWREGEERFVEVAIEGEISGFLLHPALLDAALHLLADGETPELPFAWQGVTLHQHGVRSLRARLSRRGGAVAIEIGDHAGQLVARVEGLRTRPLEQAPPGSDLLFRVDWRPADRAPRAPGGSVVAEAPTVGAALGLIKGWLRDRQAESSRLLLVTRRGVAAASGDEIEVRQAGVWGLVRAARSEHPGRFGVVDVEPGAPAELALSLPGDQDEAAIRQGVVLVPRLARAAPARPGRVGSGTILITGGTGAIGLQVARHLITAHGARDLLLVSRAGPEASGAAAARAAFEALGARVTIAACDLGDRQALARRLSGLPEGRPLRAVFHAAGELEDGLVTSLDAARLARVFRAKVEGALHLHELTAEMPLDAFVLFSSVAGLWGSPGQGAYAAASASLDALAHQRRARGLPALSLDWGPWAGAGMAARLAGADRARVEGVGLGFLEESAALSALDLALGTDAAQLAVLSLQAAPEAPVLWRHLLAAGAPAVVAAGKAEKPTSEPDLRALVRAEIARILRLASPEEVPIERPLRELGADSLTAVELRNALASRLGLALPATLVFDHPTAGDMARWIAGLLVPPSPEPPPAPPPPAPAPLADVDALSEEALDALLAELAHKETR